MEKKVCFLALVWNLFLPLLAQEIYLWSPPLQYHFPTLTFREKVEVTGEARSEKPIKNVTVIIESRCPVKQQSYSATLYFQQDSNKKTAVFRTQAEIKPPASLITVVVQPESGTSFKKTFILRIAYRNQQYQNFGLFKSSSPHSDAVRSLKFSLDNRYLLSASDDCTVKLLDPLTLDVVKSFRHIHPVNRALITTDNQTIISCTRGRTVDIWDVNSQKQIHTFRGHEDSISAMDLSPNGKYLASGDRRIILWNLQEKKEVSRWTMNYNRINVLVFSPDGRYLFSGDEEGNIKIWNVEVGSIKYSRGYTHAGETLCITVSPSMHYMYSACSKGYIKWWQLLLDPSRDAWENEGNKMWEMRLALVKSGYHDPAKVEGDAKSFFYTIRRLPVYTLTDRKTQDIDQPYSSFSQHGSIIALELNGTGEFLMIGTREGEMRIHETSTAIERCSFVLNKLLVCGTFADNGSLVALGGIKGEIWIYGLTE